jgi:hypothetical protein
MRHRCLDPRHRSYARYGGRGIGICSRWLGPSGFRNFLADMGPRLAGMSLDRIDNDGNYEPGNCRWATRVQQQGNRRVTVWGEHNGERLRLTEISERTGVSWKKLRRRLVVRGPREKLFAQLGDERLSLMAIAERVGMKYSVLKGRVIDLGWPLDRALTAPVRKYRGPTCARRTATALPPPKKINPYSRRRSTRH